MMKQRINILLKTLGMTAVIVLVSFFVALPGGICVKNVIIPELQCCQFHSDNSVSDKDSCCSSKETNSPENDESQASGCIAGSVTLYSHQHNNLSWDSPVFAEVPVPIHISLLRNLFPEPSVPTAYRDDSPHDKDSGSLLARNCVFRI